MRGLFRGPFLFGLILDCTDGKMGTTNYIRIVIAIVGAGIASPGRASSCPAIPPSIAGIVNASQSAQIPRKFDKSFAGTIGTGLRVRMELSNDNGTVHGQYFYERIGTPISLDGKIFPKGDFELSELNDEGKPTGHFVGTAVQRSGGSKPQLMLSGTWTSADGSKTLSFSLAEEVMYLGPGLDIVSRSIKQDSKKPKYEIDVNYPQISGTAAPG